MSRVGKQPIILPNKITAAINPDGSVSIKGPKGELTQVLPSGIRVVINGNTLKVETALINRKTQSLWGTLRSLINNMVKGVLEGYEKRLEIEGIGYKAQLQGNNLILNLGFSKPVEILAVPGISFKIEKNTVSVMGVDKALVGKVAAEIRETRKPEPYKGKGIRYQGEVVRRKAGKRAATTA